MKKLLFVAIALMSGYFAQAQGGLTIDNRNDPCGVYVKVFALDGSMSPAASACDIATKNLYVAAYSALSYATVWAYQSSVGWATIPSPPGAVSGSTSGFTWTDATFQFDCPASVILAGCTDAGGTISHSMVIGASCQSAPDTWSGICRGASFSPAPAMPLDDVTITFW